MLFIITIIIIVIVVISDNLIVPFIINDKILLHKDISIFIQVRNEGRCLVIREKVKIEFDYCGVEDNYRCLVDSHSITLCLT